MADEPISEKVANALFEDAEINPAFAWLGSGATIKLHRFIWGGIWVGGDVLLYRDKLVFHPNALNMKVHKAGTVGVIEIPLSVIGTVTQKPGFGTGIVQIAHSGKQLVFRCHDSEAFAQEIFNLTDLAPKYFMNVTGHKMPSTSSRLGTWSAKTKLRFVLVWGVFYFGCSFLIVGSVVVFAIVYYLGDAVHTPNPIEALSLAAICLLCGAWWGWRMWNIIENTRLGLAQKIANPSPMRSALKFLGWIIAGVALVFTYNSIRGQ